MFKKLIACEVGPNYQIKDGLIALISLLNVFNWGQKSNGLFVKSFFEEYFELDIKFKNDKISQELFEKNEKMKNSTENITNINKTKIPTKNSLIFTDSGRTTLFLLLKSLKETLKLDSEDEVLIQGFSCIVLPNSIWQAGLVPKLLDVEIPELLNSKLKSKEYQKTQKLEKLGYNFDLEDLKKKVSPKSKVLILQYTFGIVPENLQEILDFCYKNKILVIEDIAHSLGCSFKNKKIGMLGSASFFSFGRDKIISTTIGGGGFINPKNSILNQDQIQKWQENLDLEYKELLEMKPFRVFQSLNYAILTSFLIRPFYHLQFGKAVLMMARKLKLIGEVYTNQEKKGTNIIETASLYPHNFYGLLKNQLLKMEKYNKHRKLIAKIYSQKLGLKYSEDSIYMRFPVTFTEKQKCKENKSKLRKKGWIVGTWYTSIFMPEIDYQKKFNYKKGSLPNIEFLTDSRVLNLPTNIYVRQLDASNISLDY